MSSFLLSTKDKSPVMDRSSKLASVTFLVPIETSTVVPLAGLASNVRVLPETLYVDCS